MDAGVFTPGNPSKATQSICENLFDNRAGWDIIEVERVIFEKRGVPRDDWRRIRYPQSIYSLIPRRPRPFRANPRGWAYARSPRRMREIREIPIETGAEDRYNGRYRLVRRSERSRRRLEKGRRVCRPALPAMDGLFVLRREVMTNVGRANMDINRSVLSE